MKQILNGRRVLALATALAFMLFPQLSAAAVGPLEQVKGTVEGILAIMQDQRMSSLEKKEERRTRIMDLVNERFDFEEMSKRTLARDWKDRTKEEKSEFQEVFSELLKNNYIRRVESYSDEKVEYAKEVFDEKNETRAMVYTNILKNNNEIPINYVLLKKGDGWFVYDVVIEGVSLVRNYRTEFGRILGKEKFPGLVKRMKEKIEKNAADQEN